MGPGGPRPIGLFRRLRGDLVWLWGHSMVYTPPHRGVYRSIEGLWTPLRGGIWEGHFGAKIGQKEQYLWGKRVQNTPNRACRTKGYPLVLHARAKKRTIFVGEKRPFFDCLTFLGGLWTPPLRGGVFELFWPFWAILAIFGLFWPFLGYFGHFWAILGHFEVILG